MVRSLQKLGFYDMPDELSFDLTPEDAEGCSSGAFNCPIAKRLVREGGRHGGVVRPIVMVNGVEYKPQPDAVRYMDEFDAGLSRPAMARVTLCRRYPVKKEETR